jgi:hypothetical protein
MLLENHIFLFLGPCVFDNRWVQMIIPALSALLPGARWKIKFLLHDLSNQGPLFVLAVLLYKHFDRQVFVL